jgi:hypothetical protein
MPKGAPDFTRTMLLLPFEAEEYPSKFFPLTVFPRWVLTNGFQFKNEEPITTDYIKEGIILPTKVPVADPTGGIASYEAGWVCRALIKANGPGELDLAGDVLTQMANIQYSDGSWEQIYYPLRIANGKHASTVREGSPYKDIQVDSGAGLLVWAMAEYDKAKGTTTFKSTVQKAFNFLRECQIQHHNQYPSSYLLANQRWNYIAGSPVWNYAAFACDSAECLMGAYAALDAYGADLTSENGYSVKQWANDVYQSLILCWTGSSNPTDLDDAYFRTEYPPGAEMWLMPAGVVPQGISYVQGMTALAIYTFAKGPFRNVGVQDYSYLCERALNFACALTQGKWGGFYYHPIGKGWGAGIKGDGWGLYDEFPSFTALMIMGMSVVNPTLYARQIRRARRFIRLAAFPGGIIANRIKIDGTIDLGEGSTWGDGMHWRSLNSAQAIVAGA